MQLLDIGPAVPLNAIMSVLTIQSRVASGYVGNSVAVPAMQVNGVEAIAVDTVHFSNHPAHSSFEGCPVAAEKVRALLRGVEVKHAKTGFRAAITGYLGTALTGRVALEAILRLKSAGRCGFYCLDPVLGDNGRVYVDETLLTFFREEALQVADLIVPNAFEAGLLLAVETPTLETAPAALEGLLKLGPERAVITGIETPSGYATVGGDATDLWQIETERLNVPASGAGDTFTALLVCRLVKGDLFADAIAAALASVRDILFITQRHGKTDLALVEGFALLRQPETQYQPIRIIK